MNTPQFDWVRSRLPHRAQPVPPIFQPEVIAEAIVWTAQHDRREVYVGFPTVVAIGGNKVAPDLADRYLARSGYESQQTSEPEDPSRPDNLYSAVDEEKDFGARGRFDARARTTAWQFWLVKHRAALGAAAAVIVGAVIGLRAIRS